MTVVETKPATDCDVVTCVSFSVPIKLESEANAREVWQVKATRAQRQRAAVTKHAPGRKVTEFNASAKRTRVYTRWVEVPRFPCVVTITRIAPRELDSDNVVGSAKYVRDQVAELLGVDDRDPRVEWVVRQRKGEAKQYGVEIMVESVPL